MQRNCTITCVYWLCFIAKADKGNTALFYSKCRHGISESIQANIFTLSTLIDRFTSFGVPRTLVISNQLIKFELLTQSIRQPIANRHLTRLSAWPWLSPNETLEKVVKKIFAWKAVCPCFPYCQKSIAHHPNKVNPWPGLFKRNMLEYRLLATTFL